MRNTSRPTLTAIIVTTQSQQPFYDNCMQNAHCCSGCWQGVSPGLTWCGKWIHAGRNVQLLRGFAAALACNLARSGGLPWREPSFESAPSATVGTARRVFILIIYVCKIHAARQPVTVAPLIVYNRLYIRTCNLYYMCFGYLEKLLLASKCY